MALLVSATVPIPAGQTQSAAFAVPGGLKQPGVPLWLHILMDGDVFPTGTTRIGVEFSYDGGATWRGAWTDCVSPRTWKTAVHQFDLSYAMGPDDSPTHARFSTNAPAAFNCAVTLQTS